MEFYSKKQMRDHLLIFSVMFFCFSLFSQDRKYEYRNLTAELERKNAIVSKEEFKDIFNSSSLFKDIDHFKPEQITDMLQNVVNDHREVVLPNKKLVISSKGLCIPSNTVIIFDEHSVLEMEGNNLEAYELIRIHNVENVTIINAVLVGDRNSHVGIEGEWGHGVSIKGSTNITIDNFDIKNFFGDGIYIGRGNDGSSSSIQLLNGVVDFNRRNGISITSVDGLVIDFVVASNTFGTEPNFGLDIEPNSSSDIVNNILISNFTSYNNYKGGIMISLNKMIKGRKKKITNILIKSFLDIGSVNEGFVFGRIEQSFGLKGNLKITDIKVLNNRRPIVIRKFNQKEFFIEVDKYSILFPSNVNFTNEEFKRVNLNRDNIILKR